LEVTECLLSKHDLSYRFGAIPSKIPTKYFVELNKQIQKFIWRGKRPRIANKILKGRTKLKD
jgi:hypothetical protein